jgi:uncharacterized protein YkwD
LTRLRAALGSIQALVVMLLACCCVALAAQIPAIFEGSHTLVAVEPLLRELNMGYDIRDMSLTVEGRTYPNALVYRDGMFMADGSNLARFLHLDVTRRNGVLIFSPDLTASAAPSPPSGSEIDDIRSKLLDLLNEHRQAQGLPDLGMDGTAQEAAQYQADDMQQAGVMRHEDSSGRSPMDRFDAFGGHAAWYGENVGWYQLDPGDPAAIWSLISKLDADMMAEQPPDDGHRETILSPRYSAVGIGIAVGPNGLYLAEDFVGH